MEQPAPSSPGTQGTLPLGVDPSELYDGPRPTFQQPQTTQPPRVVQHPRAVDPRTLVQSIPPQHRQPQRQPEVTSSADAQAEIISVALHMVSARVLGLLALLAACAIWGYAVYDPNTPRTVAATLYSTTVLFPVILLYWREYWKTK